MHLRRSSTKNVMTQRVMNGVSGLHEDFEHVTLNGKGVNGINGTHGTNGAPNGNGVTTEQRRKMDRKKSSPMMPAFMVSAPGKVIVFGEHAVVHGKVGIATPPPPLHWLTSSN